MTMTTATETQIAALAARRVDATTREIAETGITLTHEQADDLGAEVLDWMRSRLDMVVTETDRGTECAPGVPSVSIVLTSDGLVDGDPAEYDAWVDYVSERVDECCDVNATVEARRYGMGGRDRVSSRDESAVERVREWLKVQGWESFCARGVDAAALAREVAAITTSAAEIAEIVRTARAEAAAEAAS